MEKRQTKKRKMGKSHLIGTYLILVLHIWRASQLEISFSVRHFFTIDFSKQRSLCCECVLYFLFCVWMMNWLHLLTQSQLISCVVKDREVNGIPIAYLAPKVLFWSAFLFSVSMNYPIERETECWIHSFLVGYERRGSSTYFQRDSQDYGVPAKTTRSPLSFHIQILSSDCSNDWRSDGVF